MNWSRISWTASTNRRISSQWSPNTSAPTLRSTRPWQLLTPQVRACLPGETALHEALRHSASVREALLSIPEAGRRPVLHGLARAALEHFSRRAPGVASLLLLVFDFDGTYPFEERLLRAPGTMAAPLPPPDDGTDDSPQDMSPDGQAPDIGLRYFIDRP